MALFVELGRNEEEEEGQKAGLQNEEEEETEEGGLGLLTCEAHLT